MLWWNSGSVQEMITRSVTSMTQSGSAMNRSGSTAQSGSAMKPVRVVNPLWGHCQEYKIEKNAILQQRLLSEKRSTFAYYNLTLSESFCLTDHEKQIQKFVAHWKVCQKSSQREVIWMNAYIAPKPQSVLLPALHLKFSRSLTNFQASPARHSPLRSKDRRPNHAVV